jgi:hypothetical protein
MINQTSPKIAFGNIRSLKAAKHIKAVPCARSSNIEALFVDPTCLCLNPASGHHADHDNISLLTLKELGITTLNLVI